MGKYYSLMSFSYRHKTVSVTLHVTHDQWRLARKLNQRRRSGARQRRA